MRLLKPQVATVLGWLSLVSLVVLALFGLWGAPPDRIQSDAQRRIERTERLMKQIDERRLVGEQQQNLLTVQSFLVKAREALSEKDVQRALTLADKAFLLAEELVKVVR